MFFRLTPVIKLLLIVNVAIFALEYLFSGIVISGLPFKMWFMENFALMPLNGYIAHYGLVFDFEIWQLITYQFLHGGFWHLFFNMFMLWMFGLDLEEYWGSAKFIMFYLICGIGAGLAHMIMSMLLGHIAPAIGASGSIYGLFFGFIMFNPDRRMIIFPIFIPIKAKWIGIGMIAISVFGGLFGNDGVAHFAHLGGGFMGVLLVKFGEKTHIFNFARKYLNFGISSNEYISNYRHSKTQNFWNNSEKSYSAKWEEPQATSSHVHTNETSSRNNSSTNDAHEINIGGQKITQQTIDSIIDKISQSGYASLTEQEKYILTEISKKM